MDAPLANGIFTRLTYPLQDMTMSTKYIPKSLDHPDLTNYKIACSELLHFPPPKKLYVDPGVLKDVPPSFLSMSTAPENGIKNGI